jgi:hypothetical protein
MIHRDEEEMKNKTTNQQQHTLKLQSKQTKMKPGKQSTNKQTNKQ